MMIIVVCNTAGFVKEGKALTSAEFLDYPARSQTSFINASVLIAGLIADQNAPKQARCLDAWSAEQVKAGYPDVLNAMRRFPSYHPSGVVLAVMQKQCGKFEYAN